MFFLLKNNTLKTAKKQVFYKLRSQIRLFSSYQHRLYLSLGQGHLNSLRNQAEIRLQGVWFVYGIVLTKGDLRITDEYKYIPLPMAWLLMEE